MLTVNSITSFNSQKIVSFNDAAKIVSKLKAEGNKVGLCCGGYDVLHPGHMIHFESAKRLCGVLFVGISADQFVSDRKGSGRPVFSEQLRAYAVACLAFVDYVFVYNFKKSVEVIQQLKPSYYIKGPDYINKTTPGITAEREAIALVGGEMKYTNDPKLSTTEIIDYIRTSLDVNSLLVIIDRDGTLIENDDFPGRNENWQEELKLNGPVVNYISYLQTKYKTTKVVVTNQAGVARGYFGCDRVEEIHDHLSKTLAVKGIKIDNWQYCPYMDTIYAEAKKNELNIDFNFVKEKTRRKPQPDMVMDALKELGNKFDDFSETIVVGNGSDDEKLAERLKVKYVDVTDKKYEDLIKEFS